jgi:hypothetical protein
MPWLSEEFPDWDELSDEEQEALRDVVRALGMEFPDAEDGDYYE